MHLTIRDATSSDAPSLAELSDQLGYPTCAPSVEERLADLAHREGNKVLVAEIPHEGVVGWVHVFVSHRLMIDPFGEIGGLVVHEARKGQGIGGALLQHAEAWATRQGLMEMRIRSNIIRKAAHRFYGNRGYEQNKTQHVLLKRLD